MEIYLEKSNETKVITLEKPKRLDEILKELNISLNSVILTLNGEISLEETEVKDSDKVQILSVVSGG